jgi:nicotinamide-nucleotide amidase
LYAALFCNLEIMVTPHIEILCEALAQVLIARKMSMVTAESCTGGLIAASCTQLSGSSAWFERGFVTYSNAAKSELLGVPASLIEKQGAVSEEVAKAMALGALVHSPACISVAVTGIAGPTGGSEAKPVGTVWLAWAWRDSQHALHSEAMLRQFEGTRSHVRYATAELALARLTELVEKTAALPCK